ncbi:MAG: tRNA pseudouridine(55) synthase TruB [Lentilitoribacter sp.]
MARQRKKKGRPISGWLVLDKPYDFGSTEAVSKIRWLFKAQKAGHAGTLDPLASGMLPIALGEATKTVPYIMDGRKIYQFAVTWGEERTTDDMEGTVIEQSNARPDVGAIEAILPEFLGEISQVPPQFSAIKINGERAYDVARSGDKMDIPAREVEIFRLDIIDCEDKNITRFEVECGKGTYVRSLARDFGRKLGCYGYVSELRRSSVLPFEESELVKLSELTALEQIEDDEERLEKLDQYLIDTKEALSDLPHIAVSSDQALRIRNGNSVMITGANAPINEHEVFATDKGKLLAIGEINFGEFKPKRVFVV